MAKTIFERNLESLFRQTEIIAEKESGERTIPKSITKPMKLGQHPIYSKTSQLESSLRYNGTEASQRYVYPPQRVNRPEPKQYTNFNYGIHQNITAKPIDVSGSIIPNNELKVRTNRGTNYLYRPQIVAK